MNVVEDLKKIYSDVVSEVDPAGLILSSLQKEGQILNINAQNQVISEDLSFYQKIIVLGLGKASARMASAIEDVLLSDLTAGVVVIPYGHGLSLKKVDVWEAGHPVPDENSLKAACLIADMLETVDEKTLILNLVSGGGSALVCMPADGLTLQNIRRTNDILLSCGASIDEMNCVRKHLSRIKGGGFARMAGRAKLFNLILSDVIGDRIDTIASGIAAPDTTTFQDALAVISKYSLNGKLPRAVTDRLTLGANGHIADTPKPNDPIFDKTVHVVLGNNGLACRAAKTSAESLGYRVHLFDTPVAGEASRAGFEFAQLAESIDRGGAEFSKPCVMIAGGETTVTLQGKGKGGRNQEMALAFACELHKRFPEARNIFFLSAATDGIDGPTDAAGAVVTPALMEKMKTISDQASGRLADNDAYPFFLEHGGLFQTGPTYTNVCDIQILAVQ